MTREQLIAALEAATECSRELDIQVALYLGGPKTWFGRHVKQYHIDERGKTNIVTDDNVLHINCGDVQRYTTSIDAALTLVPEGCIWKVFSDYPGDAYFADLEKWVPGHEGTEHWRTDGACSYPALALCIAALRARSES